MLGNVYGGVGIAEEACGERLNVNASLRKREGERKIIGGIGLLEIGLGDGIADDLEGIGRGVHLIEEFAGIELEIVVGGFRSEHEFKASSAFGAGGLDLLPEDVEFLAFGVDLGFV